LKEDIYVFTFIFADRKFNIIYFCVLGANSQ